MASRIETLNREIERLKEINQSLVRSCQQMEEEIFEMKEQKNAGCGLNRAEYLKLQRENEMLKSENCILKQKLRRLEEKRHNSRGAGRKNKLSPVQIEEIKAQRQQGVSYRVLAAQYGCSVGTICNVCSEIK